MEIRGSLILAWQAPCIFLAAGLLVLLALVGDWPDDIGVIVMIGIAVALAIGIYRSARYGSVRYVCGEHRLTAYRGRRIVIEVDVTDIEAVEFVGVLGPLGYLVEHPWPAWPRLLVHLKDGDTVRFPAILFAARDEGAVVEAGLNEAMSGR